MSGSSPISDAPVQAGDVLAGKFVVEHVLGIGGMGVVVAARHVQLKQRVALKFLLPVVAENHEAVSRFLREAENASQIQSEHVVRVTDVGTLASGAPYMVMEYLEGTDLGKSLEQSGRLAVATAVDYVLQALIAIAEAHAKGIVHRDLKPSNLFVTTRSDGSPLLKILDFLAVATAHRPAAARTAADRRKQPVMENAVAEARAARAAVPEAAAAHPSECSRPAPMRW
jgi:serine/threonine-protein kinase